APKPTAPAPKPTAPAPKPTAPAPKPTAPAKPAPAKPADKTGKVVRRTQTVLASWGPIAQAPAGQPPAAADPKKVDPAAPSAEPPKPVQLPAYQVEPPKLATLGPAPRQGDALPGLGRAPELTRALFSELEVGKTAGKVFEVGTGFVIVQLSDRSEADLSKFDGVQLTIGDDLEPCSFPLQMVAVTGNSDALPAKCMSLKKGIDNLQRFLYDECSKAAQAGRIRVNQQFLSAESSKFKYTPCGSLDFNAALAQVLSLSSGL
ncbi:MAG: hypothetical protein KJO07_20930, partial [Deltaproteobacteria bacterium]|nr:hypothetical protein [Deltaproteobacteria bacterium]